MEKIIFTIDVDAFFAQVEEKENPNFINKPLIIGYELNGRGVVTTANYPARKLGIHSAQPIYKAKKIFPNLIIVEPNYSKYTRISDKIFDIASKYTNIMEVSSIDECYIDVTNFLKNKTPFELAKEIQDEIFKVTNLTVSIGISDDKILAKISSNFKKPNGISSLFKSELKDKLWPLDIEEMYGIGFQSSVKFKMNNINTIGELANIKDNSLEYENLRKIIGINLNKLINRANGNSGNKFINYDPLQKSISFTKTFENDISDYDQLIDEMLKLTRNLSQKMKYRSLISKTFALQVKDRPKKYVEYEGKAKLIKRQNTKQLTIKFPTNDYSKIKMELIKLLNNWWTDNRRVRFIGVSARNLIDEYYSFEQMKLDDLDKNNKDLNELDEFIKNINQIIGKQVIATGDNFVNIKRFNNKRHSMNDNIKFKRWSEEENELNN